MRSGVVELNPGPDGCDLAVLDIQAHCLAQLPIHPHTSYTLVFLRNLRQCCTYQLNHSVQNKLQQVGISVRSLRQFRGRRVGQRVQQRAAATRVGKATGSTGQAAMLMASLWMSLVARGDL
jgi:hypothetical protein